MRKLATFITARATSWIVLIAALGVTVAMLVIGPGAEAESTPGDGLPPSAESVQVSALLEEFPSADTTSAIFVFTRDGAALSEADVAAITEAADALAEFASGVVRPPAIAEDKEVAILVVPLEWEGDLAKQADRADGLRAAANDGLPDGLRALLTGAEGFDVDVAAVFDGANFTLLLTTVIVVAVLLIVTYRSPWLWLVPLTVIGLADALAGVVAVRVAHLLTVPVDPAITGILSVLVFGAGTNYALLLIARYRDELRLVDDRREAMRRSLRGAGPAVIASGSTVILSLLTLLFGQLSGNHALGIVCATGILIAMLFALLVLPAALTLFGRWLFWPMVPRLGGADTAATGLWAKLGTLIARKPVVVVLLGALVLGGLALGATQVKVGLAQTDRFITVPEAVEGQRILAESFPAGSASPTVVITDSNLADEAAAIAESVDGVDSVAVGESHDGKTQLAVVLDDERGSEEAFETIKRLRVAFDELSGDPTLVGGLDAHAMDAEDANLADQNLVIPLILIVVLMVLIVLLRSLLAPLLLLVTVVASYFASFGASWLIFQSVFGFPALDIQTTLLSFLFLVALGIDYNIFLITRAREEAVVHGTRAGMIRALASTGGVITSAGILLAAVFAVLGVLPLITLTQIGVIVCVGVLLDTLIVRTIIVPSLVFIAGDRFWWPRRVSAQAT